MPLSHPEALAQNAILRGQLHIVRERNRVLAAIARQQNDALLALIRHMNTHDSEKPSAPQAEGSTSPNIERPSQ